MNSQQNAKNGRTGSPDDPDAVVLNLEDSPSRSKAASLGHTRTTQMKLTWDVLAEVMLHLKSSGDCSRMMRSCHTLYTAGAPELVKDVVYMDHPSRFLHFCSFMIRNGTRTFQRLRKLELHLSGYDWQHISQDPDRVKMVFRHIARMFNGCTHLEKLGLIDTPTFCLDKRIAQSIASLPSLRKLVLSNMDEKTEALMQHHFKGPVQIIYADFNDQWVEDGGDPVLMFQHFTHSLRGLRIFWAEFSTMHIRFPYVTTLQVEFCNGAGPAELYSAFPNLRFLAISEGTERESEFRTERWRQHSLQQQLTSAVWPSLEYFDGDIAVAYGLGLQCKIEHLSLDEYNLTAERMHLLRRVLSDSQPTALVLQFSLPDFDPSLLEECLSPSQNTLVELGLRVSIHGEDYSDPTSTFYTIFSALASSQCQIRLLRMWVDWRYHHPSPSVDFEMQGEELCFVPHVRRRPKNPLNDNVDFGGLAQEAAWRISSLRNVCFITEYSHKYHWEACGDTDGETRRTVKVLSESQGEAIFEHSTLGKEPTPSLVYHVDDYA